VHKTFDQGLAKQAENLQQQGGGLFRFRDESFIDAAMVIKKN
jgi:hypothetical protein